MLLPLYFQALTKGSTMNNVLLVGNDGSRTSASTGTGACTARTIRFRNALASRGFSVSVCSPGEGRAGVREVTGILAEHPFDCIVAISPFPAEAVVMADPELPLWIDMNGMHSAELQLESDRDGRSGERMLRMLSLENMLLSRGDAFSAPSRRQSYAVYGELLLLGRNLQPGNCQLTVSPIPHCSNEVEYVKSDPDRFFRIISTGSFNLWFDETMLFNAFEFAMSQNSSILAEITGGRIPFSPEKYDNFCEMVAASKFKDRFLLHGWVSKQELTSVYSRASVAVYTDIPCAETRLGARTRVLDWVSRGIPVVCTEGAEISDDIRQHNLGVVVPPGDSAAMAEAFLALAADNSARLGISQNQKKWSNSEGSPAQVFTSLFKWCENPCAARKEHYGKPTVPVMNSLAYLSRIYSELAGSAGFIYALKRVLRKMLRFSDRHVE